MKVGPNFRNKISFTYTLLYLIGLGGLCVPHLFTHSWKIMNTQKHLICINILIIEPFLTHLNPIPNLFIFKCPYTYTIDIFSCLFSTCIREWSKLVIKALKGENNYHLCSWHQSPFKASQSWFLKFMTKSKLIQSIICKKTSSRLAFEIFSKINI
jgi:hypothetical protein